MADFVGTPATPVAGSDSDYTLGALRTRLAAFYTLDATDSQVLAILNECIQTGYEKVVSMANSHARQLELTIPSVARQRTYTASTLGIPTFVGYKTTRLTYKPYEVLRGLYNNFDTGLAWDDGDPIYYSLVGFTGKSKTLVIVPTPKETGESIHAICFKTPAPLVNDADYPLVPADWAWLVLERAKIERLRFEEKFEAYQIQAQEFVAYVKVMLTKLYPAEPDPESGFILPPERIAYNLYRANRT